MVMIDDRSSWDEHLPADLELFIRDQQLTRVTAPQRMANAGD